MSFSTELTGIANKEEENRPPSYHGETTLIMDETTLTSNNKPEEVEEVIKVDDAIESIGFGKFQRRVL